MPVDHFHEAVMASVLAGQNPFKVACSVVVLVAIDVVDVIATGRLGSYVVTANQLVNGVPFITTRYVILQLDIQIAFSLISWRHNPTSAHRRLRVSSDAPQVADSIPILPIPNWAPSLSLMCREYLK